MPASRDLALGAREPLAPWSARGRGRRGRSPAVVRPPSVRRVSATCASVASAGWQQVKSSSSRSSGIASGRVHRLASSAAPRRPRAASSSRPGCARGGSGRSPGCAPSSPASAPGSRARPRAASARRRSRTPPGWLPRRGRCRRGSRPGRRGRGPTRRAKTRSRIVSSPLSGRTSIQPPIRAAGTREATSIAASRSSASSVKKPPSASLVSTKGPSVIERLAVLDPHRRRHLRRLHPGAGGDAGGFVDRLVVARRSRSAPPRRGRPRPRGRSGVAVVALVDQHQVLHLVPPLRWSMVAYWTNGKRRFRQPPRI